MATPASGSGLSGSSVPPSRPPVRSQSVNYVKPQSDWRHDEGASTLLVYLTSFLKENLRITYEESNRSIRVRGDRRLPNNRLVRVNESYPIPEECDGSKFQRQFGRGILMVTLPKIVPKQDPKATAQEAASGPAQSTVGGRKTTEKQGRNGEEGVLPSQAKTDRIEKPRDDRKVEAASSKKAADEPKSQKGGDNKDVSPTITLTTSKKKPQNEQVEIPTKAVSNAADSTKHMDEKKKSKHGSVEKKEINEAYEKVADQTEKPADRSIVEKAKESKGKSKESTVSAAATVVPKAEVKENGNSEKSADDHSADSQGKGIPAPVESSRKAPAPAVELNGEKAKILLVNIGVAALVLLGLGAFIYLVTRGHKL